LVPAIVEIINKDAVKRKFLLVARFGVRENLRTGVDHCALTRSLIPPFAAKLIFRLLCDIEPEIRCLHDPAVTVAQH
jgi:hypothetical protein